jgi:hypothetical protein
MLMEMEMEMMMIKNEDIRDGGDELEMVMKLSEMIEMLEIEMIGMDMIGIEIV